MNEDPRRDRDPRDAPDHGPRDGPGDGPHGRSTEIRPDGWPRGAGYAHGVAAAGRVITISGQVGWDPITRAFGSDDLAGQTDRALANIVAVLAAAGARPEHVVRMTWYVVDREAYLAAQREIGAAYRKHFGRWFPAMSVVVVAGLLEEDALVEIEATAVV